MSEWDDGLGFVDRGTFGVHGGAVVLDLDMEISWLRRFSRNAQREAYWWPARRTQRIGRLDELVPHFESVRANSCEFASEAINNGDKRQARAHARDAVCAKLALPAPYVAILRAGEAKRSASLGRV